MTATTNGVADLQAGNGAGPDLPDLPVLPDLDGMIAAAVARVDHFTRVRVEANEEIRKAQVVLGKLGAGPKRRGGPVDPEQLNVADRLIAQVLTAVGNHNGCGLPTAAQEAGVSHTTAHRVARLGEARGWVRTERRKRRMRVWLTDAGMEWVTDWKRGVEA